MTPAVSTSRSEPLARSTGRAIRPTPPTVGWTRSLRDPASDASNVTVLDARHPSDGPLGRAWFDHHLPPTLHGTFALGPVITG
jgi:hypothetical protein